jgi:hypothetical protein
MEQILWESRTVRKYDRVIPAVFFLVFVLLTAQGISWGAPGFWHPDELVQMVDKAIDRHLGFDEKNFDYPSLPKYVMYGVGKLVYHFGLQKTDFIEASRLISVILGGLVVALAYLLTRWMGGGVFAGVLAALFLLTNRDYAIYSRFAHADLYLAFFVLLSTIFLIQYRISGHRLWLYGAFLGVGMATSSKYNGVGLVFAVLAVFFILNRHLLFKNTLSFVEILFIGSVLTALGYALGTPKSLLWMAFYFKRATPAILRQSIYDRDPGTLSGIFGQWGVLWVALGIGIFLLLLAAVLWYGLQAIRFYTDKRREDNLQMNLISILLLCIVAMDLPIAVSYHYPPRFFLSITPLLSVLTGQFVEQMSFVLGRSKTRYLRGASLAVLLIILVYSFLRVIAVGLLFINDNRIAASKYLETLPEGATIEITASPPNIPTRHFSKQYEHPIYTKKFAGQAPPAGNASKYNQGEAGVEQRQPDYLIVDSFTYEDFLPGNDCTEAPLECEFFQHLLAGETNYQLVQSFDYRLPAFLPVTRATFVNPVIQIYQRKSSP